STTYLVTVSGSDSSRSSRPARGWRRSTSFTVSSPSPSSAGSSANRSCNHFSLYTGCALRLIGLDFRNSISDVLLDQQQYWEMIDHTAGSGINGNPRHTSRVPVTRRGWGDQRGSRFIMKYYWRRVVAVE